MLQMMRQPENPTCFTFPYNLMLHFRIVDIGGAYPHVQVQRIFVVQDSASNIVGDVEMVSEGIVLKVLDCLL